MKFRMRYAYHDENDLVIINGQGHSNIEKLGILKLYRQHIDIVEDIAYKAAAYHWDIGSFSGLGLNEAEIDRIVWGSVLNTAAYEHRPFSKLTPDILEQLGIQSSLRDQNAIDIDSIRSLL